MKERKNKEPNILFRKNTKIQGEQIQFRDNILLKKPTKRRIPALDEYSFIVPWQLIGS